MKQWFSDIGHQVAQDSGPQNRGNTGEPYGATLLPGESMQAKQQGGGILPVLANSLNL